MQTKKLVAALLACAEHHDSVQELSGSMIGALLVAITEHEVVEGGPYGVLAPSGKRIPDLGLSLLVEWFLYALDVTLPNLTAYIESAIESEQFSEVLSSRKLTKIIAGYQARASDLLSEESRPAGRYEADEARILERIIGKAKQRFAALPADVAARALQIMARTIQGNADKQMSLMAQYTREALGRNGTEFTDDHIAELGLANIFFWSAFIIYDDFWDVDEAADPQLLPIANLFARHYTDYFSALFSPETGFREYFRTTMDALDAANAWETKHCRMRVEGALLHMPTALPTYGSYEIKYYPAAGHILGPVALLVSKGFTLKSSEIRHFIAYFKHYLITMQLNDDMHDWKEDIARGHISTAVCELLSVWKKEHPNRTVIHLERDMRELEQLFWFRVLPPLCEVVLLHAFHARAALTAMTSIEHTAPLERFITRNEKAAREALKERARTDEFISVFA